MSVLFNQPLSCNLPRRIELIYSILWKKKKKDRNNLFLNRVKNDFKEN